MPRLLNRKVEIRFEQESLDKIDDAAKACGLSRAEFIRNAAMGDSDCIAPDVPRSVSKPRLTPDGYLTLVQGVYRALGGSISRSTAEQCVALTVRALYNG